jgi:hypothetical protein
LPYSPRTTVTALIPELDDYLRPAEAQQRFAAMTRIELVNVEGGKHLWVGEAQTYRVLSEIVARLNELFECIVPIVAGHRGHIDQFIGDAVLAVFGAPERIPQHADRAVQCAVELARTINSRRPGGFEVGVGVNTGPVVAGSIGGAGRLSFSVIGDPVNLALRGEADQIHAAMAAAGWTKADEVTLGTSWRIVSSTLTRRSYGEAPVSPLFLFSRQQDFAYQQEVDGNPAQRHHRTGQDSSQTTPAGCQPHEAACRCAPSGPRRNSNCVPAVPDCCRLERVRHR